MTEALETKINFKGIAADVRSKAIVNESELCNYGVKLRKDRIWEEVKRACEFDPEFSADLKKYLNNAFWEIKLKSTIEPF